MAGEEGFDLEVEFPKFLTEVDKSNRVPRVLSLPRESAVVTAGHVSMHANPSRTEGGSST